MNDDGPHDEVKVGFGRPPVHSRFKKGRSGNPKGRRKGLRNFQTDLKDSLAITVSVSELGKPKRISTQAALLLRAREKALKGDNRALEHLLNLARLHNTQQDPNVAEASEYDMKLLSDEDLKTLERILTIATPAKPHRSDNA